MNDQFNVTLTREQAAAVIALIRKWREGVTNFNAPVVHDLAQVEMAIMKADDARVRAKRVAKA